MRSESEDKKNIGHWQVGFMDCPRSNCPSPSIERYRVEVNRYYPVLDAADDPRGA